MPYDKEPLYHDDRTLVKVREALVRSGEGLSYDQAEAGIIAMQNFGIYFREARRDGGSTSGGTAQARPQATPRR